MQAKHRICTSRAAFNLIIALCLVMIISCKKKDNEPASEGVEISGSNYPVVRIGSQYWTAVNYNGPGGLNPGNDANNPLYGKLYSVQEAKAVVLPEGWRLPTREDFERLASNFPHRKNEEYMDLYRGADEQLLSADGWSPAFGKNTSGFNAVPAGHAYVDSGGEALFRDYGQEAYFFSSTSFPNTNGGITRTSTYIMVLAPWGPPSQEPSKDIIGGIGEMFNSDWYRYSVRFVKDAD